MEISIFYSFTQQIFIEHQLCVVTCTEGHNDEQNSNSPCPV